MTKREAVNRVKNIDLSEKGGQLWLWKNNYLLKGCQIIRQRLWLIKKVTVTKSKEKCLEKGRWFYKGKKEGLQKMTCE